MAKKAGLPSSMVKGRASGVPASHPAAVMFLKLEILNGLLQPGSQPDFGFE